MPIYYKGKRERGWVGGSYHLVNIICLAFVVHIDHIKGVPAEEDVLVYDLCFAIGCERLVQHQVNVEINCGFETLLTHELASVAGILNLITTDFSQILDDFGADQISLS